MTPAAPHPRFVIKGWHVLVAFLLFFGADIAVNTIFMVSAYRTFPGETSVTPYEDGLAYDSAIAQQRAQAALGWRMTAGFTDKGDVQVQVFDRSGAPVNGLIVVGRLQRPATETGSKTVTLKAVGPGLYVGSPAGIKGAWDLDVTAHDQQGHKMVAERRLMAP